MAFPMSDEKRFEVRLLARTAPAADLERSFSAASWVGLCAALVILILNVAVSLYRLALPSDGWSVGLFVYAGQAQLILIAMISAAHTHLALQDPVVRAQSRWMILGVAVGMGTARVTFILSRAGSANPQARQRLNRVMR
jgi:hypothetical protein